MTATAKKSQKPKRTPRHVYARVREDGSLVCEDNASRMQMRRMKIRRGQLVRLVVSKERDYGQWKKAHALGTLIAQNLDDFADFVGEDGKADSHGALKKLQRLSGVECDAIEIEVPGFGTLTAKQPRSLAFDELSEPEFQAAYAGFCDYLRRTYWADLDPSDIAYMASLVGDAN